MGSEALVVSSTRLDTNWILDSNYPFHISPFRHWFSNIKDVINEMVLLDDNYEFQSKGIGSIKLSLLDEIIRILSDGRFVLELRRNLSSLGILDSFGYSIKVENGTIRVIKVVILALKVVRANGLYMLHGLTLDSKGGTSVVQSLDSVMVWYRILGHISEKGFSTLVKLGVFGSKPLEDLKFYEHYIW